MKLLVVDDEEQIREGIKRFISTLDLPVAEIRTASDGQEALLILKEYCPDVILSDVVMPGMDGIQLIREIRQQNKEINAIMISGYSDLSYLKSAFKVDAIDYILKPVNIEEFEAVLTKVFRNIEERRLDQISKESISKKYEESLPVLRCRFLSNLISGTSSKKEDICSKTEDLGFPGICNKEHVVIAVAIGEWEVSIQTDIIEIIESAISEKNDLCDTYTFEMHENEIVIVLFFSDTENIIGTTDDLTERIMKKVRLNFGTDLSAGVSDPGNDLTDISESYKQASEAVKQSFIFGMGSVVRYKDICDRDELDFALSSDLEKRLISLIYAGDVEGIDPVLNTMFTDNLQQTYRVTGQKIVQIRIGLIGFIHRLLNDMGIDVNERYSDMDWSEITQLDTLDSIRKWLGVLLRDICENTNQMRKSKSVIIVDKIKEIINDKYNEPIGVQEIAEELKISNNYLSAIFKQSTGISFTRYLTKVRLEKAKELIEDSLLKIQDIAVMVGYEDQNYFSRVFRRQYGISPSEMREIH